MTGETIIDPKARSRHFDELDADQKAQAIRDLKAMGFPDSSICAATGLSIEGLRAVLGSGDAG